ncbi:immunoglobulin superfamily member 2 isoform X2 [Mus pahari]|uniref:immunoglobulin superfamily member 2 isoform X2 n=1 Tax=Mus pahari TaxID=10093 RepID=UPI0011147076|nr:immunoglobulin superfamily member 2 isoform X2 [Mus pahari]
MACILCVASLFLSLTKFSIGQREVKIQEGPLYRAEGYPISISCNVTGHRGPSTQDFQWSIYLPSAPTKEVQIISTKDDAGFSYAVYAQRVKNKEIYIERLQGDSVLLHISKLQMKDAGEYECHTPNTDGKYFGSYSAKTNLTATEIVSLSKDFVLTPGSSYADRFVARDIRLDKLGATSFRLSIGKLQPSDQGQVFCEATEWIQDPDETWTLITRKQTDQTVLRIQPAARDFEVSITADSSPDEGKPLELVCLVVGRDGDPQLQGTWFLNGKEIAQTDAGGVLGLKREYRDRASQGQLQVSKLSAQTFSLKLFSVGPEDVGTYSCEVAEVARTQTGSWQVLQRKQSPGYQVQLREPAARSVTVSAKQQAAWEGETLTLLCKAAGDASALSVSWWLTPQDQTTPVFVAGMGQDGTVQLGDFSPGPAHHGNRRLEKVDWATFRLEIASAMVTDSGTYECRVSERPQNQAKGLQSTQKISVTVKSLKSSLRVNLMSRQPQVMLAHTFDLSCIVRADYSDLKLPISVTWQFQPAGSGAFQRLIQISHNGTVEWGDVLSQIHRKTKVSQSFFRSQLQIHDAAMEETGVYRCKVEVYDRGSVCTSGPARVSATSNLLMITVTFPESKLSVNSSSQVQELSISSSTQIECAILSRSAGNLPLSIIWYFSPVSANASYLKILETDQTHVVKYGDEFQTPRSKQKFYSEKVSQDLFLLNILSVEDSDQGHYHCAVEEWLLSTNGTWQKLGRKTSGLTELKLKPTGSQVHVSKVSWTGNATENGEAGFLCSLDGSGSTASLYSVTWYWGRGTATAAAAANATATTTAAAGSQMLVHLQYDGLLQYGREGSRRLQHCYRSSPTDFVLKLHQVEMEDAGMYWCRVTEWQQHGHPGKWINQASGESQRMALRVLRSEPMFFSRICSSGPLLYFLIVCPFIMLLLLSTSFLCLYRKARKLSQLSLSAKKEKALWVGMRKTSLQKEAGEEGGGY